MLQFNSKEYKLVFKHKSGIKNYFYEIIDCFYAKFLLKYNLKFVFNMSIVFYYKNIKNLML